MMGRTHFTCGEALALCLLQPSTPRELLICLGGAAVGSVISDVDVTTSESHQDLVRIVSIAGGTVLVTWAVNTIFELNLERFLLRFTNWAQVLAWAVLFLALCVFGTTRPHRTFMHSLTCLALLGGCVWMGAQPFAKPFCLAMASHIVLDLFNKKKVQVLYPLKWSAALGICSAQGVVDKTLCLLGSIGTVVGLVLFALKLWAQS